MLEKINKFFKGWDIAYIIASVGLIAYGESTLLFIWLIISTVVLAYKYYLRLDLFFVFWFFPVVYAMLAFGSIWLILLSLFFWWYIAHKQFR